MRVHLFLAPNRLNHVLNVLHVLLPRPILLDRVRWSPVWQDLQDLQDIGLLVGAWKKCAT